MPNPHWGTNMGADVASHVQARNQHKRPVIIDSNHADKELIRIQNRVDSMEQKLHSLVSKSNERAILFAGSGFQSISDSNAPQIGVD
jgi:hypothetical protein